MRRSPVSILSCAHVCAQLDLLDRVTGGAAAFTPEQRVMLALTQADAMRLEVNIKYLETHYSGARSSFQLLLARLVNTDVIRLRIDPKDRRSKLVTLSPTARARLGLSRAAPTPEGDRAITDAARPFSDPPRFAAGLETWLRLRGDLWMPARSAVETIALSSRIDVANAHVVERSGDRGSDFRFLHIGAIGADERRRMSSNLLSSLPNEDYRRAVFDAYSEAFDRNAPTLQTARIPTAGASIRGRRRSGSPRSHPDRRRRHPSLTPLPAPRRSRDDVPSWARPPTTPPSRSGGTAASAPADTRAAHQTGSCAFSFTEWVIRPPPSSFGSQR